MTNELNSGDECPAAACGGGDGLCCVNAVLKVPLRKILLWACACSLSPAPLCPPSVGAVPFASAINQVQEDYS